MICNVILTFLVLYSDGHKEDRTKWMSKDMAKRFVYMYKHDEQIKTSCREMGIIEVKNFKIKDVKPYDCYKGPEK
jgi:hypothetical protein